jgi:hypothetical protein
MCELADGQEEYPKEFFLFKVNITNKAPYFEAPLKDQTVRFNKTTYYDLPSFIDPEKMYVWIVLYAFPEIGYEFLAVYNDRKQLKISPNVWPQFYQQPYTLEIYTDDGHLSSYYTMKVNIFNTPPRFTRSVVSQRVRFNSVGSYLLPKTVDDEENPVIIINKNLPKFITFEKGLYTFTPTNPQRDLGPHVIRGELTDTHMFTEFVFSLFVFNEQPFFNSPLRDQRVFLYN